MLNKYTPHNFTLFISNEHEKIHFLKIIFAITFKNQVPKNKSKQISKRLLKGKKNINMSLKESKEDLNKH